MGTYLRLETGLSAKAMPSKEKSKRSICFGRLQRALPHQVVFQQICF